MTFIYPNQSADGSEHLGKWFKREIFQPNDLQGKDVAQQTGISESKLSKFLNEKVDLDNDLAIRLAHYVNSRINTQGQTLFHFYPADLICAHARYKFYIFLKAHQRDLDIFNSAVRYGIPLQDSTKE
jgi:transcriptional regulator with XRE-family HTH domain